MKNMKLLLGGAAVITALVSPSITLASSLVGSGLTISPITQNISAQPGETVAATIKVSNPTDSTVTAYPVALDFRSDGTSGQPSFYKTSPGSNRFSLSSWFQPDQTSITVPSQQAIEFGYHLRVPLTAEAGGHYGAALFAENQTAINTSGVKVDVKSMVGTLLFLRIAGDIQESAKLLSFVANKIVSLTPVIDLNYQIQNAGNIHLQPYGEVTIKNWRGQTVSSSNINPTLGYILPDSTRLFTTSWKGDRWSFGHYTANLAAFYGTTNQPLGEELGFWVIPLWSIFFAFANVLILYIIIRFRPRLQFQTHSPKNSRKR